MYISYKNAGMKNNSIFTFSQNIWQGDSISVYFFVCKFEKKNSAAPSPPPPSDATCLDQNRIFKVKTREDRMVKDESIQRVKIKKIETLYIHLSYRGKTINCSNRGKKNGTVLQMSLECTLEKQLHREDRSKLM